VRSEDDVLQDRVYGRTIKLDDEGPPDKSISVLKTVKFKPFPVTNVLKQLVKDIKAGNRTAIVDRISDADLSNERIPSTSSNRKSFVNTNERCWRPNKSVNFQHCEMFS
jgi:hypothetical protein